MGRGAAYAIASAVLFGVSTPIAKVLVGAVAPLMLAGLLYAGSGAGLLLALAWRRASRSDARLALPGKREWAWLAGAILFGGVLGPVALLEGLTTTPASTASLLLNLEAVFTAFLAWFVVREHFDRRIALGMVAIVAGGVLLSSTSHAEGGIPVGAAFIAGACLCWAIDNNLTRMASTGDAVVIAALKGVVAGAVNLAVALAMQHTVPAVGVVLGAAAVGFLGYGVSLVLFVLALRHLGSARASAYFSVAPFFGAAVGLLAGDAVTVRLGAAAALMGAGVWLHLSERHAHEHVHEPLRHTHSHRHDEHHRHAHDHSDGHEPHTHEHVHEPLVHAHPHYPDVHHRHPH